MKSKVEKLDIGKLETTPVYLSKLSNVVKNDVVQKDVYNAKIKNIEDKISDMTNLATETTFNSKINEGEIPSITNCSYCCWNLVKKTDYNTNITEIEKKINDHDHDKYITTLEFNKLTVEILLQD